MITSYYVDLEVNHVEYLHSSYYDMDGGTQYVDRLVHKNLCRFGRLDTGHKLGIL